ncbi:3'-5' exonuclease [Propionibacterium freudenreichii subsp. shermanii]|nr:3'-5' exonuclease [Propionibacterium freudenreichii subsp. shermanii]
MSHQDSGSTTPDIARSGQIDQDTGMPILAMPHEGLPELVDSPEALTRCIEALASGTGPVAIDTERAQSFRYTARAYLLQFRRTDSGTWLIDPQAFQPSDGSLADFSALREAIASAEWIIHAATQDLPCLVEIGLYPSRLFDTELAGRLLGFPRVSLGTMIEQHFGVHLLKEHSAADWSRHPLPPDWIAYAALDVELLIELRNLVADELVAAGKKEWADEEFAHLVDVYRHPQQRPGDPWRHTSGSHHVRSRRGLALVRALWEQRDEIARELDKAPGKIVPDKAISELASEVTKDSEKMPTARDMNKIMGFRRTYAKRYRDRWVAASQQVGQLSAKQLPPMRVPHEGPPHQAHSWQRTHPEAWARWQVVRPAANEIAEQIGMPPENLIQPEALRWLVWKPLPQINEQAVRARLSEHGVRHWQQDLLAARFAELLAAVPGPGDGSSA